MNLSDLENTGFSFLNMPCDSHSKVKQIVVVGVARGGTSIAAGSLYHLGVHLGDTGRSPVFEDLNLSQAFEDGSKKEIIDVINKYDQEHELWAWKRPSSIKYLRKVDKLLSDPYYIFVFRDVFSIANRNAISMNTDIIKQMSASLDSYKKMLSFISSTKRPALLVSAEKMLTKKELFIDALIKGLNLNVTEKQREKAISFITKDPAEYLDKTRATQFLGYVDTLNRKRIVGWAKSKTHHDPMTVEVYINNKLLTSVLANQYREGLKSGGYHPEGTCAFFIDMTEFELPKEKTNVIVRVKGDKVSLMGGKGTV